MREDTKLKDRLLKIKDNNWTVPEEVDTYALSLEMMTNIGSTDPELRDTLIYGLLTRLIMYRKFTYEQMRNLLEISLGEHHLFCGIGQVEDDSVFKRTFTSCIINSILDVNNQCVEGFLSAEDVAHVHKEILRYCMEEKDVRGYVDGKGWAHSSAHVEDVLCSLAEAKTIEYNELIEILQVIKEKICIGSYTYINEEDERLINAFMCILNRSMISDEEIINWINSFVEIDTSGTYQQEEHLRANRKTFLRSLFFRFKKVNSYTQFLDPTEKGLDKLPAYY